MRAISPHKNYSLQLVEAPVRRGTDQSGNVVEFSDRKPVIAEFRLSGLLEHEQLAALEHFNFSGLPEGINPLTTISVWDSEAAAEAEGWSEEVHEQARARLVKLADMNPASCLVVLTPEKQPPWPAYERQTPATIFRIFEETGFDVDALRIYEIEHQNREAIVGALEAIAAGTPIEDALKAWSIEPDEGEEPVWKKPGRKPDRVTGGGIQRGESSGFVPSFDREAGEVEVVA